MRGAAGACHRRVGVARHAALLGHGLAEANLLGRRDLRGGVGRRLVVVGRAGAGCVGGGGGGGRAVCGGKEGCDVSLTAGKCVGLELFGVS